MDRIPETLVLHLPSFIVGTVRAHSQETFHYVVSLASGVLVKEIQPVFVRWYITANDGIEGGHEGWIFKVISGEDRRLFNREAANLLLIDN